MNTPSKNKTDNAAGALLTFATKNFSEAGTGIVIVAREAGRQTQVVTFAVDAFCLGVRKISTAAMPLAALLDKVLPALHAQHATAPVAPGVARAILEGAAAYAKKLGFSAPANFAETLQIFGDESPVTLSFPFGKNGKPHYEQQPGDDEDFAESVLEKLRKSCGENGFSFELTEAGEEWLDGEDPIDTGDAEEE